MNPAFPGKGASRPPDVVVERREYHSHCDCARLETRIKSLENDNGAIGCMSFLLLMLLFGVVSLFPSGVGNSRQRGEIEYA